MAPDFSKKTVDILAKRSAFKCSNPECRKSTVGPCLIGDKATLIGEAAHIYGARPRSKRYDPNMSDAARAEITNGIWLCRNCHKIIDTDDHRYTSEVLFVWREKHEEFTFMELGNTTDRIYFQRQMSKVDIFSGYPPLVRRIAIDKPYGWEYRLTAELMRHFNQPLFRRLTDLKQGLYIKGQTHVEDIDALDWAQQCISELGNLVTPIVGLLSKLTESWGKFGEPGNTDEILHITCLIRDYLEQVVQFEEKLYFTNVSKDYQNILELLKGKIGTQMEKIKDIPNDLDEIISIGDDDHGGTEENPTMVHKIISIELPKGWDKQMSGEFKRLSSLNSDEIGGKRISCSVSILIIVVVVWLITVVF